MQPQNRLELRHSRGHKFFKLTIVTPSLVSLLPATTTTPTTSYGTHPSTSIISPTTNRMSIMDILSRAGEEHHQESTPPVAKKPAPTSSTTSTSRPHNHHECNCITTIGPNDVVTGRDKLAFNNGGNRRMRLAIASVISDYLKADNRRAKSVIIRQVVQQIRSRGGRFLKYCTKAQCYIELDPRRAHEKCSHAFRDQAARSSSSSLPNTLLSALRLQDSSSNSSDNGAGDLSLEGDNVAFSFSQPASTNNAGQQQQQQQQQHLSLMDHQQYTSNEHGPVSIFDVCTFDQEQSNDNHNNSIDDGDKNNNNNVSSGDNADPIFDSLDGFMIDTNNSNNNNNDEDDDSAFLVRAFCQDEDNDEEGGDGDHHEFSGVLRDLLQSEPSLEDMPASDMF